MSRVLVCRVGWPPVVAEASSPFLYTKAELIGDKSYVETVRLDDGVYIYCDEDGRAKCPQPNRDIPALMPMIDKSMWQSIIYMEDDPLPAPGELGVHRVYGNFLLTRHEGERNVDLTDADIKKYLELLDLPKESP